MKTNLIMSTIAIVAIVIAIFSFIKAPSAIVEEKSTFDKVLEKEELVVCTMVWPDSVIKDPDTGEFSGFIIDILNEIASDANFEIKLVESTWGGFPADLNTGKCDAAIAGIYSTIGRSTSVSFTRPFFYAGNSAVAEAGKTRFKDISDLNRGDIKIAVIQGEFGHIYAQRYLPKAELVVLEKSADLTLPLVAVSSGKADVGFSTSDTVEAYVRKQPGVKDLFPKQPYSTTPISWAVRKDDQELLNFLDNAIAYLKATGFLDATAGEYRQEGLYTIKEEYATFS